MEHKGLNWLVTVKGELPGRAIGVMSPLGVTGGNTKEPPPGEGNAEGKGVIHRDHNLGAAFWLRVEGGTAPSLLIPFSVMVYRVC